MPQRITATPAALDLLERLRAEHGDLIIHISGGCCDGSSPMCLRAADLPASPHDVELGALADVPIVIDGDQDRRWLHPSFHLDTAPGAAGGFSLEALEDVHFTAASTDRDAMLTAYCYGWRIRDPWGGSSPTTRSRSIAPTTRRPRSPARSLGGRSPAYAI